MITRSNLPQSSANPGTVSIWVGSQAGNYPCTSLNIVSGSQGSQMGLLECLVSGVVVDANNGEICSIRVAMRKALGAACACPVGAYPNELRDGCVCVANSAAVACGASSC